VIVVLLALDHAIFLWQFVPSVSLKA